MKEEEILFNAFKILFFVGSHPEDVFFHDNLYLYLSY